MICNIRRNPPGYLSKMTSPHWLEAYSNNYHAWQEARLEDGFHYIRRLGYLETSFEIDGAEYEGRADLNMVLEVECQSTLSTLQIRQRILLAWASLRAHHSLLRARIVLAGSLPFPSRDRVERKYFAIPSQRTQAQVVDEASATIVFVEDNYPDADADDLYRHITNTTRTIGRAEPLAKLFVLPIRSSRKGTFMLKMHLVAAHCIADGLTAYSWNAHLLDLLNQSTDRVQSDLKNHLVRNKIWDELPKALDDLYPPVVGNIARQRWFWAISRVLRHSRAVHTTALPNPLRRPEPLARARRMAPKFNKILDYSIVPPLNSFRQDVVLSVAATHRLQRMCREIKVSIGAGAFAYVGIVMMELSEARFGSEIAAARPPCVLGFPLNPRPFFGYKGQPDSLLLAFSDGVALPFLPSDLALEGRFKLLARLAQRHLSTFQKRLQDAHTQAVLGSRSIPQILASSYLNAIEWGEAKLPEHRRVGTNPQGALLTKRGVGGTCGVSSIGSRVGVFPPGKYKLDGTKDLAAAFRDLISTVRVREGEFLVGTAGDADRLHFNASYDGNALDEVLVGEWADKMQRLLEPSCTAAKLC